jgi:hypothetical protein
VFFRHTIVAQRSPSELELRFNQLAIAVSEGKLKSPRDIWLGVGGRDGLREVYVADDDFREAFSRFELSRARKARLPRYILFTVDAALKGPAADFETSPETLEHVLPENPGSGWQAFSEEDRRRFTNALGNYVLLDRDQNKQLGNATFLTKAPVFRQSPRPTTRMAAVGEWTPQAVIERQKALADAAVAQWRVEF